MQTNLLPSPIAIKNGKCISEYELKSDRAHLARSRFHPKMLFYAGALPFCESPFNNFGEYLVPVMGHEFFETTALTPGASAS
jgi:hypothetical protein